MTNIWRQLNEDGSLKYNFDGIPPLVIPNAPDSSVLRDLGLTIVHPVYCEKDRFDRIIETWKGYSDEIKRATTLSIIDDFSIQPVHEWTPPSVRKRLDFNLLIHRIMDDLKWNTPGALNLGVHTAPTDWVLMMDSDCIMHEDSLRKLLFELTPNEEHAYFFMRKRITNDPIKAGLNRPLSCSILIHKLLFEKVGGFDEDFTGSRSGGYGAFDWDFGNRILANRRCVVDIIITEYIDKGVQERTNVSQDNLIINRRLLRSKQRGDTPRNIKRLNFKWEKKIETTRW